MNINELVKQPILKVSQVGGYMPPEVLIQTARESGSLEILRQCAEAMIAKNDIGYISVCEFFAEAKRRAAK